MGSIEARDIPNGDVDVIVCEAFVGNVILKLYEGLSSTLISVIKQGLMSTLKSKIGAALALPALKKTLKSFDATEYGGAPLLGLKGLVVKTHGSAKSKEVKNSIIQCVSFKEQNINVPLFEISFSLGHSLKGNVTVTHYFQDNYDRSNIRKYWDAVIDLKPMKEYMKRHNIK